MSSEDDPARPAARIPRATYRLQLNHDFPFSAATRVIAYLARLGISHVYVSPILKARPGSLHGYDVIDHSCLNPELGTREEFDELVRTLRSYGMGLIVDIVPNHLHMMGHVWWLDVLENGPAARCATHFDIDWRPNRAAMRDRVLVPILGCVYGAVLERGELKLEFAPDSGSFALRYAEHLLPIDPREYPRIFQEPIAQQLLGADDPHRADFDSLLNAFGNLPSRSDTSQQAIAERYRDKEAHKRRLARLIERSPQVLEHIRATVTKINGTPGEPASFDALDALLDAQAYRLSYWRVAVDEINYRRFFDVNDLAALRMDEHSVFDSAHQLIFELIEQGSIDGLRVDHADGLYDPEGYFERLQQRFGSPQSKPLYVVAEKILAAHERLPESWFVHGTTGYEFGALATGWLVYGDEQSRMTRRYRQFTRSEASFEQIVYESKRLVMRASLAAEIEVLATQLDRIAQQDRHTADFTRAAIREAIRETIACFPVYRTYISPRGGSEEDRRVIHWAIGVARKRSAGLELTVFDFLRDVLLGRPRPGQSQSLRQAMLEFTMKFQQVTAPVAAKGVEDTAFYRYNRLVCLNEVGADPGRYGVSANALHQANLERARLWPHSLLSTSTHDSKRSEDVRARIAVLSELPDLWARHLSRWVRLNRSKRRQLDAGPAPDGHDEYLLYQTLLGLWSAGLDLQELSQRLKSYAVKAAREAKRSTSWIGPDAQYEKALCEFVEQLLEHPQRNAFLKDFGVLAEVVAYFGRINSLVQTVLKATCPGVPDFFQGTELPALTLVDPDNRRPVDFASAMQRLERLDADPRSAGALLEEGDSGSAKLYVTRTLLELRAEDPALFERGDYQPLQIEGAHDAHALAFARVAGGHRAIVIVPRCVARLMQGQPSAPVGEQVWLDTRVILEGAGAEVMRELFTRREVRSRIVDGTPLLPIADVLAGFPVALLYSR